MHRHRRLARTKIVAAITLGLAILLASCSEEAPTPPAAPDAPTVGDVAPAFELRAAQGGAVSLDGLVGHRPILLYFSMGPG
jgi:hypothetical protein